MHRVELVTVIQWQKMPKKEKIGDMLVMPGSNGRILIERHSIMTRRFFILPGS
jgi:hypothetical protein